MFEFLKKFVNCGTKIARVNSNFITKSINLQLFTLILNGAGVRCDRRRFSVFSPFIEKSMITYKIECMKCLNELYQYYIRANYISSGCIKMNTFYQNRKVFFFCLPCHSFDVILN